MTRADPKPKRPKTGGRQKGTPNKATVQIKDAMLSVFADLQAESGSENGHFLDWARGSPTDFYRLATKLLPTQVTGEDGGPIVTRIELVAPGLPFPTEDGEAAR
jgi:hypothetical protein